MHSKEIALSDGSISREFDFTVALSDSHFHARLHAAVPVLFGVPLDWHIPADVLSVRCSLEMVRLAASLKVCVRIAGGEVTVFLRQVPEISTSLTVTPSGIPKQHVDTRTGEKLEEIAMIAIKRAIEAVAFPNALRVSFRGPTPEWSRTVLGG
jgi:hypothetical protein